MILLNINFAELGSNAFEIIILLLITAIIAYFIGRLGRVPQKDYDFLLGQKNNLQEELNSLNEKFNDLKERYSSLEKENREQRDKNRKLNNEVYAIRDKVSEIEKKLQLCQERNKPKEVKLTKNEETLERIKAKSSEIDFNRIGIASLEQKDDLKQIKGIGKFIEEKLNALGIYQFKQIANFTSKDEDIINKAIEFFPGRVKRDDWRGQSKELS